MRAKDVVKLFIENKPVGGGAAAYYDYSDGIISIDIRRGMNEYLGPHTQIDTGSLIITSRNPNLDPMAAGSLVRYKNRIKVQVDDSIIFIGRIENIDVKYQPKNEPPIITITAFDYVRDLVENRWTNQSYLDEAYDVFTYLVGGSYGGVGDNDPTGSAGLQLPWVLDKDPDYSYNRIEGGASCTQLMQYIDYKDMITDFDLASTIYREPSIWKGTYTEEFWNAGNWVGQTYYHIKLNDTFFSIFNKLALTNLGWFYCTADGKWNYVGRNGNNTGIHRIDFSSEAQPGTESYRSINIVDGFERIYNKLTTTYQTGTPYLPTPTPESTVTTTTSDAGSISLWGTRELQLNTGPWVDGNALYPTWENLHEWMFLETATPHREVSSISWNGMNNHNVAKNTDINDEIGIQYISDIVSISANYRIVGIRHRIDANDWIIEYILRNYDYTKSAGEVVVPLITASKTNATNIETVNFSVTNSAQFFSVVWDFGDGTTSTSFNASHVFSNLPAPGQTYGVTATCVDTFGRTVTSTTINMTITGQTPILYTPQHYDKFTSDTVGQHWFYANASNYDTLTWQVLSTERGTLWNPGTHTSTNHKRPTNVYPYGSFTGSGSYQNGSLIKPGSMGEVTVRVTGTNTYGTTYRDMTWDAFSTNKENINGFNARYIKIYHQYTGTSQYAYTGAFSSNYHDINPQTNIKNIHTYNFAGTGTIIQAVNNNGTIKIQDGTTFNLGTHAGYLTDLNDNTGITIDTNLGTLVSGNKYRINPDWYIVIDLGTTRSLTSIFPEWDMDKDGFPFRTTSTLSSGKIWISYSTTQSNGGTTTGWSPYASFYGNPITGSQWDAGASVALKDYSVTAQY